MDPYEQGGLDGLCGVYSIINASRIINSFNSKECQELFEEIIKFLDSERNLSKLLISGLDINIIGQILNNVKNINIKKKMPYKRENKTTLGEFWTGMQNFLEKPNRAILLGLGGVHDHWTVVESISEKQIKLFDSDKLKRINRSSCTTGDPDKQRRHQIKSTHTYFMFSVNEQD